MILHADLDDMGEVRMVQPRGETHFALPVFERRRIGRLHARQRQHQLLPEPRIEREPDHRRRALTEQLAQLEAPERAGDSSRRRARNGRRSSDHRGSRTKLPLLDDAVAAADAPIRPSICCLL